MDTTNEDAVSASQQNECDEDKGNSSDDGTKSPHIRYTDAYIGILDTYKKQYGESSKNKKALKSDFFKMIKVLIYWMIAIFVIAVVGTIILIGLMIGKKYTSTGLIINTMVPIVSSLVTMSISIIKLPKIIARYLFNKKEDNSIRDIIKNIQEYEINVLKYEKAENKLGIAAANKALQQEANDDEFEDVHVPENEDIFPSNANSNVDTTTDDQILAE